MKRPCNDDVTPIFEWLYIGGVKNTRKTLPLVDVWYDFKCDTREPKHLKIPEGLIIYHILFDDGDLETAKPIWKKCFKEILEYKKEGKKIFISCYEGVSRSAVLALWLCCEELGNYEQAYQHLKRCRNIHIDKNFFPFLEEFKMIYANNTNDDDGKQK
jgi:protein-tyrosine phosphatase